MTHILLLGDSIFDNASYVAGGPDVVRQLRSYLPGGWQATLGAVDGAVINSVARQLERAPGDATHLVVSVGGNDALHASGILDQPLRSMAEALEGLARIGDRFEHDYRRMLDGVEERGRPTALCTIYNPRFPDPVRQRLASTALAFLNDIIVRQAVSRGLPLLELRLICNEDRDYANPIEPSVNGGDKIARTILRVVAEHDFAVRRTAVFAAA